MESDAVPTLVWNYMEGDATHSHFIYCVGCMFAEGVFHVLLGGKKSGQYDFNFLFICF